MSPTFSQRINLGYAVAKARLANNGNAAKRKGIVVGGTRLTLATAYDSHAFWFPSHIIQIHCAKGGWPRLNSEKRLWVVSPALTGWANVFHASGVSRGDALPGEKFRDARDAKARPYRGIRLAV
jgi:hypothetical protein